MYELAAFRAFQGIGAGGIMPLALAVIGDITPPRERARYQGYMMAVFASASVLGPVLGCLLSGESDFLGVAGWRWIFYINVPFAVAALIVIARVLKVDNPRRQRHIDWWGSLMLVVGLVPLLVVAEQGQSWGWSSAAAFACYFLCVAGLALFVWIQHRMGDDALLPLRLFRSRTFSVASGQVTIIGMAMFGGLSVIPLYLQIVKGASPTKSGLLLLPLVGGLMLASFGTGQVIARTGRYTVFPVVGSVLMVTGMGLLVTIGADTALWSTDVYMAVFGIGLGLNMQSLVLAMQNAVPARDMGVASAASTFFRSVGGTLAPRSSCQSCSPWPAPRSPESTPRPPATRPTSSRPRPTPARSPRCTRASPGAWTTPRSSAGWPSPSPTRSSSGSPPPGTWSLPSLPSSSSPRSSCPPASRKFRCGSSPATRPGPRQARPRAPWRKPARRPSPSAPGARQPLSASSALAAATTGLQPEPTAR
jgi:predicted MFS family arabinose efflux permease